MRLPTDDVLQSLVMRLVQEAENAIAAATPHLHYAQQKLSAGVDVQMEKLDAAILNQDSTGSKRQISISDVDFSSQYSELTNLRGHLNETLFTIFLRHRNDMQQYCKELGITNIYDLIATAQVPISGEYHRCVQLHLRRFSDTTFDTFQMSYILWPDIRQYLQDWLENLEKRLSRPQVVQSTAFDATICDSTAGQKSNAPKKRPIAEQLGVLDWSQLEIAVSSSGIKYRKSGTDDAFRHLSWGALKMREGLNPYRLLIDIARHRGTFPPDNKNRHDTVFTLNKVFCDAFGLKENPFRNKREIGTQAAFGSIRFLS